MKINKITSNVHTHCTFCDGADTAEIMVEAALGAGFTDLGFSSHAPAPYDPACPGLRDVKAYHKKISDLKKQYEGKLGVLCGIEQDFYTPVNPKCYDYVIGSTHFLPVKDGKYIAVDASIEKLVWARDEWFGGNAMEMVRAFYALSVANVKKYPADIVGHFDLITKYNANSALFDEASVEYMDIALSALDEIINEIKGRDGMVEMNTGAISRGQTTRPYPADFLLRHLKNRNVRVIISSDCHSAKSIDFWFVKALELMRNTGFTNMAMLQAGKFIDVEI